jgi:glycosyltransferase involved in cell wall biosynthesis
MKRAVLYLCYYHLTEPLVRTQVVAYLEELAKRGVTVHLLTFERERLSRAARAELRRDLAGRGIAWYALRYHAWPSLPATLFDILVGMVMALWLCCRHRIDLLHARSHVAAAMAWPLQRLLGYPLLFDVRGLLAEEYVDAGRWREGELKFRLTKGMERRFFHDADAFVMLTERIKAELTAQEPTLAARPDDITVIPCCVDTERFRIADEERQAYRRERGWDGRRVLTYVGKIGTWYLPEEMAQFFAAARGQDPRFFLQVYTQSDPGLMRKALEAAGVPAADWDVRFCPPQELPRVLAASDAGLSFIRASYSKRASSPTKVGEYLAAGLPVVANAGVGDCDTLLTRRPVGVVVHDFTADDYRRAAGELARLLDTPGTAEHCRRCAEEELSLDGVGGPRYAAVYARCLRPAATRPAPAAAPSATPL